MRTAGQLSASSPSAIPLYSSGDWDFAADRGQEKHAPAAGPIQSTVFKAEMPDEVRKKLLVETFSAIWSLNDKRKVVAHCPFSPGEQSGVVFRRAVASKRLHVKDEEWTDLQFQTAFAEADKTRANLGRIIAEMVPYTAATDFSDPRNSGYIAVVL